MLDTLLDFEAVADPAAAAAGGDTADPGAGQGDPAAALSGEPAEGSTPDPGAPAAPGWSPDDPAFQQFLDERDAQILARARDLNGSQTPQPPPGPGIDLNEFLNPLGDNYGENMARFLADRDQHMISQMRDLFAPVLSDREQAEAQRGSERMDELIATQHWNVARDGALTSEAKAAIRDLAPAYMEEYTAVYGETPAAAEKALGKAAATVRAINAAARGAGAASNLDTLNAVANAPGEPGSGAGGAIDVPPPAKSPQDVFVRYFGPNAARPA